MKYYKISSPLNNEQEHVIKIVAANSKYEAMGYFLMNYQSYIECIEDVHIWKELEGKNLIQTECVGFPKYKSLAELHSRKDNKIPCFVIETVD